MPKGQRIGVWTGLLVLGFLLLEIAIFGLVMVSAIHLALGLAGSSMDDPAGIPFALGFLAGSAAGLAAAWPFERLCRRLTGTAPLQDCAHLMSW